MAGFCEYCGSPLEEGARVCACCNAVVTEKAKEDADPKTGARSKTDAPSLKSSSGVVIPDEFRKKNEQRTERENKAGKRGGHGFVVFVAVVLVIAILFTGFIMPGFIRKLFGGKNAEKSTANVKIISASGVEETKIDTSDAAVTLGTVKNSGLRLFIEQGAVPKGSKVEAKPISDEEMRKLDIGGSESITSPVDIKCNTYDGTYFGDEISLTLPIPEGADEKDTGRLRFGYYDEKCNEVRYLFPDKINFEKGTMTISMPHFSLWWGSKLTPDEEIEQFLDKYAMQVALDNDKTNRAAAELEPYIKAKAEALGLTKEAQKELIDAVISSIGNGFDSDDYGVKTDDETKQGALIAMGTDFSIKMYRAVQDGDSDAAAEAFQNAANTAIVKIWDELKFSERAGSVFKPQYAKDLVPGAVGTGISNTGDIATLLGCIVENDTEGALEAVGSIMQSVHPAVSLGTKGAKYAAAVLDQQFTDWKSNQIEELYQVYKHGATGLFGNEVVPQDKESFLTFLNTSSGFTMAKGVARFYNMDKTKELCKKYGWGEKDYYDLDEKYKAEFERRNINALLDYFNTRIKQENEADRIKEKERVNIKEMMNPEMGCLYSGNYARFFGEKGFSDFNLTSRLERLVKVRAYITRYINMDELDKSAKRQGEYNLGYFMNSWIYYASTYKKDEALKKFLDLLKSTGFLKEGMDAEFTESKTEIKNDYELLIPPDGYKWKYDKDRSTDLQVLITALYIENDYFLLIHTKSDKFKQDGYDLKPDDCIYNAQTGELKLKCKDGTYDTYHFRLLDDGQTLLVEDFGIYYNLKKNN